MQLFLTGVLPFLAHDHPSAAAFLTCRHHNFHSSIIPEFLSDEERVKSFCYARQKNELEADIRADFRKHYEKLYKLFVRTPLMQFSPSLAFLDHTFAESILKPLLATKYFARSLQRSVVLGRNFIDPLLPADPISSNLVQSLSKIQSLTELDIQLTVENQYLEIIINSLPCLETLNLPYAECFDSKTAISIASPPPSATKTLRSLKLENVDPLFATQFVSNFSNLRKLELRGHGSLNLLSLSSALPLLQDIFLGPFTLENTESLKNLQHLSSLQFGSCRSLELSFLTQENSLPELTTLCVYTGEGLSTSLFASLAHAPNLHVLQIVSKKFDNDCLQYLENMVHLRKLDLSFTNIVGDSRSLKSLMRNLLQLEELSLWSCHRIGNQGAIAGALFNTHSRLRVLNLSGCGLVDGDLNGIGALKNTLEVLYLRDNSELTNEALVHCKVLVKLKKLKLSNCFRINDLSPLKGCLSLEELNVSGCRALPNDSFKVFSNEPNSFPNLRILDISSCEYLTKNVFEHLAKNNNLIYQLKELRVDRRMSASPTARNNICQLKRLRRLEGLFDCSSSQSGKRKLQRELLQRLKNLDAIY